MNDTAQSAHGAAESPSDDLPATLAPRDGIYRRGFGLKSEITEDLQADWHSELIEEIRAAGGRLRLGDLDIRLAREFGFCYGVDKAIDFAYETRRRFPDKRIFLTAEIIHNPRVNRRMTDMGIAFLSGQYAGATRREDLRPDDVVILPAFGVAREELDIYRKAGCIMVDTTCGSVVHVWKRVEKYAREGFTSFIHGKYAHEETIATASHALAGGAGAYIVALDRAQADLVCDFIRTGEGREELARVFAPAVSPGFDFDRDLTRIGVANQTTMLSTESLEIGAMIRAAMIDRYGEAEIDDHFRSFDTICNATQERQDAVLEMMKDPPDLMLVIGGFNSSNTHHLCEICEQYCPAFHIEDADGVISAAELRHKPAAPGATPVIARDWLPARRPLAVGLTAGASTPNRVIRDVIERLAACAGADHVAQERA